MIDESLKDWITDMRSGRDGWVAWYGGTMPVSAGETVDLAWMDGDCEINERAGDSDWALTEGDEAIVAYRAYGEP